MTEESTQPTPSDFRRSNRNDDREQPRRFESNENRGGARGRVRGGRGNQRPFVMNDIQPRNTNDSEHLADEVFQQQPQQQQQRYPPRQQYQSRAPAGGMGGDEVPVAGENERFGNLQRRGGRGGGGYGGPRQYAPREADEHVDPNAQEGGQRFQPRQNRGGRGGGFQNQPRYDLRPQQYQGQDAEGSLPETGAYRPPQRAAYQAPRQQAPADYDDRQPGFQVRGDDHDIPQQRNDGAAVDHPPAHREFVPRGGMRTQQPIDLRPQRYQDRSALPAAQGRSQRATPSQVADDPTRTQRAPQNRRNNFDMAEVEELFKLRHNQKGISFQNYESIAVEIVPNNIDAATAFAELQVCSALERNIARCGYDKPTPVQKYGIPVSMAGHDLMACAQTGSGKTAAFLIPVVNHLLREGVSPGQNRVSHPVALVMAPTRELALQIYDECRKLCFNTDIWCDVVYGGKPYPHHFEQDILVACPGRLTDVYDQNKISFSCIKFLILDEADRMLEMGFEEQIQYLVEGTDMPGPADRQTLMFSATFPVAIRNLAQKYLRKKYYLLTVGRVGSTTKNITQRLVWVEENEKQNKLMDLLSLQNTTDLVLVFVETKQAAEDLYSLLYDEGIPSSTIHGGRKQPEREAALKSFKDGTTPILVATDVAARGLDIPNVAHVIQYDLPQCMDDYTHRIGRTARAGNEGLATGFFNDKNTVLAEELLSYLREHEQEVPDWLEEVTEQKHMEHFMKANREGGRGRRGGRGGGRGRGGSSHHDHDVPDSWDGEPRRGGRGGARDEPPRPQPKAKLVVPKSSVADGGF